MYTRVCTQVHTPSNSVYLCGHQSKSSSAQHLLHQVCKEDNFFCPLKFEAHMSYLLYNIALSKKSNLEQHFTVLYKYSTSSECSEAEKTAGSAADDFSPSPQAATVALCPDNPILD